MVSLIAWSDSQGLQLENCFDKLARKHQGAHGSEGNARSGINVDWSVNGDHSFTSRFMAYERIPLLVIF